MIVGKMSFAVFFLYLSFLLAFVGRESIAAPRGVRASRKMGLSVAYATDPFWMGQANLNVVDPLRFTAGYGQKTATVLNTKVKITLLTVGAALMVPHWAVTPLVGLDYSVGKANATVLNTTVEASSTGFSERAGIDVTTKHGLNLGIVRLFGELKGTLFYAGIYF